MSGRTAFRDERKLAYLNSQGAERPLKSPLPPDTLTRARAWRLSRLRALMDNHDVAGLLLYDPVNIRYAFDCANMSVWTSHNPLRYALVLNAGPAIMFELRGGEHLSQGLPGIDELRNATGWMFMCAGDRSSERLSLWVDEIAAEVREHGGGNRRLAVDRIEPEGIAALNARQIDIVDGGRVTETARSIKSGDEIELMRWTIRVCEAGMARIYQHSVPGVTERELWAHLHFENARSGANGWRPSC